MKRWNVELSLVADAFGAVTPPLAMGTESFETEEAANEWAEKKRNDRQGSYACRVYFL